MKNRNMCLIISRDYSFKRVEGLLTKKIPKEIRLKKFQIKCFRNIELETNFIDTDCIRLLWG